jgi:hypothetical protein
MVGDPRKDVNDDHLTCSSGAAAPNGRGPGPDGFVSAAPAWADRAEGLDYLTRDDLEALGVPAPVIRQLLAETQLAGHGGGPAVEAARLADVLALLDRDGEGGLP